MDPQLQENAHTYKMYYLVREFMVLLTLRIWLWNPALKENGFTQQFLFKFYFGCVTLKKIPSGDYIGYFPQLGIFITRQIL